VQRSSLIDIGSSMATRAQLAAMAAKIESRTAVLESGPVKVTVFFGETEEHALQLHRKRRPDHGGRRVWFQHRPNQKRDERSEYLATALSSTEDEQQLRELIARRDGETRGAGMILPGADRLKSQPE
jgi:hypothetical protein